MIRSRNHWGAKTDFENGRDPRSRDNSMTILRQKKFLVFRGPTSFTPTGQVYARRKILCN